MGSGITRRRQWERKGVEVDTQKDFTCTQKYFCLQLLLNKRGIQRSLDSLELLSNVQRLSLGVCITISTFLTTSYTYSQFPRICNLLNSINPAQHVTTVPYSALALQPTQP